MEEKIQVDLANLLTYVGQIYQNPREALKEYVANSVDRWMELTDTNEIAPKCVVNILLKKDSIEVRSSTQPGRDREELRKIMNQVALSAKPEIDAPLIGSLGIGIFAFNQFASKAEFYSRRRTDEPTWKMVLNKSSDKYSISEALKREKLISPGMDTVISGLDQSPFHPRATLNPEVLLRYLAEKFDYYLREGFLDIVIEYGGHKNIVKPSAITLPVIAKDMQNAHVDGNLVRCNLWFDPTGRSRISIRHAGIPIISDIREVDELIGSAYSSGNLSGKIDANFLTPLPSRGTFENNDNWKTFIDWLICLESTVKSEVDGLKLQYEVHRIEGLRNEALREIRKLFSSDALSTLTLPGGMTKEHSTPVLHRTNPRGKPTGNKSTEIGNNLNPRGARISFNEAPFELEANKYSSFAASTVQINTLHPDYKRYMVDGTDEDKKRYYTILGSKEIISFNDTTGKSDYWLEKLLSITFSYATLKPAGQTQRTLGDEVPVAYSDKNLLLTGNVVERFFKSRFVSISYDSLVNTVTLKPEKEKSSGAIRVASGGGGPTGSKCGRIRLSSLGIQLPYKYCKFKAEWHSKEKELSFSPKQLGEITGESKKKKQQQGQLALDMKEQK